MTENILNFKDNNNISNREMIKTVLKLSVPAIMAQLTSVVMQYIDAAMVGSLGAEASAAIGLVSTTTWLIGGLCISAATGFSVQIAHLVGAQRNEDARCVFRQGLILTLLFGMVLSAVGICISGPLPSMLGGDIAIQSDASKYFLIYVCALPAVQIRQLSASMLQCSGDMRTPSMLNILLCVLDVMFNSLLIFPTRTVSVFSADITLYGAGMGVGGAALGTAFAEICVAMLMLFAAGFRSDKLAFKLGGSWRLKKQCIKTALKIALPTAFEHTVMCGAYIASTLIVAPLGTVSIAANSLAVTAESFCYMPGYGVGSAATTLIGQSIGAERRDISKRFARVSVLLGVAMMSATAIIMFIAAPFMFAALTPSEEVRLLGTDMLRIEAFAEPLYAASIVCAGVMRGAGDTFIPSILNLASMWGVRITTALILTPYLGLYGVWIAMCGELCVRGILFLIRLKRGKWLRKNIVV